MNFKKLLLIVPALFAPYIILLSLLFVFYSAQNSVMEYIMRTVFNNNGLFLVLAVAIYFLVSLILSIVCFCVCITQKCDALSLAKTAMIIKLIQIPAYIVIFLLSVIFLTTIFLFAVAILFFILNCMTLIMTGLLNSAAVIRAIDEHLTTFKCSFWVILLQFVFCADVVASIVFYVKTRKRSKLLASGTAEL